MKTIIKIFPYLLCLVSYFSYSQDLTITSGSSLTVLSGTDFYVNGLAFTPSADLTLDGPLNFSRTATPVGASIDRVFSFSNPIIGFQGDVTFFYDDTELNGVTETNLVLQVKNDLNVWNSYTGTVEPTGNTITYPFASSISFSTMTATASGVTLSISKFNELKINLFPNPVISSFQISTELSIETLIYNNLGQLIFKSKEKNIDASQLSAGTYLIIVKDIDSNNFNTYQIIKL